MSGRSDCEPAGLYAQSDFMNPQTAYDSLRKELFHLAILRSTAALVGWDEQTHLPDKGTPWRSEQMAFFGKMAHEHFTKKEIGDLISAVEGSDLTKDPQSDAAANIRELRRSYNRATKVPSSLVEEMAKHDVLSQQAWVEARKNKTFPTFAPWLKKTYDLKRQEAECVGYKEHVYDALLDDYEPYETAAGVRKVLEGLRDELVGLVKKVQNSSKTAPELKGPFPLEAQEKFGKLAAEKIGFDFASGRLDVSVHPFCSGMAPGDTRMTTRYDESDLVGAFFGVLHETGHGLYEQGLKKAENPGLPIADAISLGIHESQSRMWENLVGRSQSFWTYFGPIARQHFSTLKSVSDEDMMFAFNDVAPTFIRTESDEVTYNLHILLRFELETALLTRELDAKDLPDAWNAKMKQYLGITPPDDAKGCLQDVHWSCGLVGYFPTYTLGNLYSAQFFEQARKDLGDLDAMFAKGEYLPLLGWLRKNIHEHGKRYSARDLAKKVTGNDLSPVPLMKYLRTKVDTYYA